MSLNSNGEQHKQKELLLTQRHLSTLPSELIQDVGNDIEYLDLSYNRLNDLLWLSKLENLKYLILDCNRLREAHLLKLNQPSDKIKLLMLNKNELTDLNATATLLGRFFPNLEYLSLHGNPICPDGLELQPFSQNVFYEYDYYRSRILCALPRLKFLDHSSVQRSFTVSTPQRKASILKFTPRMFWAKLKSVNMPAEEIYHPLPSNPQRHVGYHWGIIRKKSMDNEYKGTESEGNRFISNNDL